MKARKPERPSVPDDGSGSEASAAPPVPLPFAEERPRPIGPERLKALREAIRNGTYPTDRAVESGLARLFRHPS